MSFDNRKTLKLSEEDKKGICFKCKKEIIIDIPFISQGNLMYRSKEHGCGEKYIQYIFCMNLEDIDNE